MFRRDMQLHSRNEQEAGVIPETRVAELRQVGTMDLLTSSGPIHSSSGANKVSVTLLDYQEAIAIVNADAEFPGSKLSKDFFDVFGTSGCLLNCEIERIANQTFQSGKTEYVIQSNKERHKARLTRRNQFKQARRTRQEWFTASKIIESVSQGCGSCHALSQIIQASFPGNEQGFSKVHEYSITVVFELKRRLIGTEPVESIQLFQPKGLNNRFQRFYESRILSNKNVSIDHLRRWLNECSRSHGNCLALATDHEDTNLPTRLLSLTPILHHSEIGFRLIETTPAKSYRYACLSHRWDDAVKNIRSTTTNILESRDFLKLESLPANFRDAISIARELNIPYLWIDSLCIIQEGDNGKDLRREIAKMGSIFRNSCLTIAIVSSPDSSGGCFMKDKWQDICFMLSKTKCEDEIYLIGSRVLDMKGRKASIDDFKNNYPLLQRAWVFQERLLSPRLLQCTYGEFTFECLTSSVCECQTSVMPPHRLLDQQCHNASRNLIISDQRRLLQQGIHNFSKYNAADHWKEIVEIYMQLKLSIPCDVLPAIAGCAQAFAHHFKLTYVAGIWKEMLPMSLLWYLKPLTRVENLERPKDLAAPTWSWASLSMGQTIKHIDSRIGDIYMKSECLLQDAIKDVYCEPVSASNPFGKFKDAYLKFEAVLHPWYLRSFCWRAREDRNGGRHAWQVNLHIVESKGSTDCTTNTPPLALDGAHIEIRIDVRFADLGLVSETFGHCVNNRKGRCTLTQIYLLHALHKEGLSQSLDIFLLLKQISATTGKPNCYQRVGLVILSSKEGHPLIWQDVIDGRLESRQEEFWLF